MNLHGFGQGLGVSPIALPRYVAPLSTVMLLVHQVVSGPESHQAGIVGRCWDRDRTCASYISVAQLVCQDLELICCETVVIPKDIIMGWSAGALDACMAAQVEVKLKWVSDVGVHSGPSWDVTTLPNPLILVSTKKAGVMSLLYHDVRDPRLVVSFQFDAGISNGKQLIVKDLRQLALRDPISVEDDSGGLESGGLVELDEQLPHHIGQVLNDLLPWTLYTYSGTVSAGVCIHTAYHCCDRWFLPVPSRGVCNVCSQKNHWLLENSRALMWDKDVVDATKFDIDLEAEVGQSLR